MAELELGATLIPEPPGMTTVDLQARPAASALRSGLRLGLLMHQKTWGLQQQVLWGLCLH